MRIGVASLFAFRPHVEQLAYLARLARSAGHEIESLTCDAAAPYCYSRLLRGREKLAECPRCIVGGVRSYPLGPVYAVRSDAVGGLPRERARAIALSSAAVRFRSESPAWFQSSEFQEALEQHAAAVDLAYTNAMRWLEQRRLDAVLVFNGRMDMPAGVLNACLDRGIPVVSVERPWHGHGLHLVPNGNCLDLAEYDRLAGEYQSKPLNDRQARHAAVIAQARFRRTNELEWRVYNRGAVAVPWPVASAPLKVLVLPSSRNEFEGHPHWNCDWGDYPSAFQSVLEKLQVPAAACVVRCHPNWSERIGLHTGWRSEEVYARWCSEWGAHLIPSESKVDTYSLVAQSDLVVVSATSSGVDAALLGKRVLMVGHSSYQRSGLGLHVPTVSAAQDTSWSAFPSPDSARRSALRFLYFSSNRFPQFVDFARAVSPAAYEYREGAEPDRLLRLVRSGHVEADDGDSTDDPSAEDAVLEQLARGDAVDAGRIDAVAGLAVVRVERRIGFRWVDSARRRFRVGDR